MTRTVDRARPIGFLARRSTRRELLDQGVLADDELATNLADLERLNRLPGGVGASVAAVARLVEGADASVLDVGAGRGDIALAFTRRGWRTVALDSDPAVLAIARARLGTAPNVGLVHADGRALPFDDGSFDVAHCSLLVHHLDPPDAVALLREMGRVARRGVVINDLRRGLLPLAAVSVAVALLGRCRATRHDGRLSVRRAYTLDEIDTLLAEAGLGVVRRSPAWLPRVVTTAVRR